MSKKPPLQNLGFKWWEHVTYRTAGVREYWIVDPTKNFILVYDFEKNGSEQYTLQDSVIAMADALFSNNIQLVNDGKFIIYFTEYGMTRFLQEGLFEEIPPTFYHPLNIEQCIRILREIAQCCHNGSYRIVICSYHLNHRF